MGLDISNSTLRGSKQSEERNVGDPLTSEERKEGDWPRNLMRFVCFFPCCMCLCVSLEPLLSFCLSPPRSVLMTGCHQEDLS